MIEVRTREGADKVTCPLCRDPLGAAEDACACAGCSTRYHGACLAELGGCSTLGCSLEGVAVGTARALGCGVCGRLAAAPSSRRRCGCGATVHQACVDGHAAACERGRRLQGDGWRPVQATGPRAPASSPPLPGLRSAVLVQFALIGVVAGAVTPRVERRYLALCVGLVVYGLVEAYVEASALADTPQERRRVALATAALLVPLLGPLLWWLLLRGDD